MTDLKHRKVGWIGAGRMGTAMATRLAKAGCDLLIYNRTRAKAEPLAQYGARIADRLADLADRDIVFAVVATGDDLEGVLVGPDGLFAGGRGPRIVVDFTTISFEASAKLRAALAARGAGFLAAPVSGNAKVAKAGKLSFVASGPRAGFDGGQPYLAPLGEGARPPPAPRRGGPDLRRRGIAVADRQDLPQRVPRRRDPVAHRDHGAGAGGR